MLVNEINGLVNSGKFSRSYDDLTRHFLRGRGTGCIQYSTWCDVSRRCVMQISGRVRSEGGSKPGEIICKVAEEEDVAMIIVGTRGLGKVRRAIMGSVSDYVVHHAPCPVIVCRQ